jgi:hypothetical protein
MKTTTKRAAVTEAQAYEALRMAQIHEDEGAMATSAKSCALDAASLFNKGDFNHAYDRARESIRYSVGVFHSDMPASREQLMSK